MSDARAVVDQKATEHSNAGASRRRSDVPQQFQQLSAVVIRISTNVESSKPADSYLDAARSLRPPAGRGDADRCPSEDTCVRFTASTLRHRHLDPSGRSSLLGSPVVLCALRSDIPATRDAGCRRSHLQLRCLLPSRWMDRWLAAS